MTAFGMQYEKQKCTAPLVQKQSTNLQKLTNNNKTMAIKYNKNKPIYKLI